jgi:hypothetical protein
MVLRTLVGAPLGLLIVPSCVWSQGFIPETVKPTSQRIDAGCIDCVQASRAVGANHDQTRVLQHLEVLGDRWLQTRGGVSDRQGHRELNRR